MDRDERPERREPLAGREDTTHRLPHGERRAVAFRAGDGLQPSGTAKTVRGNGSEPIVTDGPFAETKEQLGGFYVIDVPGEAEALEWASKMPNLPHGSVEVRPVMLYD